MAKQSKTHKKQTQLIICVINYLIWYLHLHLSPLISLHVTLLKNLLSCCSPPKFTFTFHIPVLHLEKTLDKTLLSH